MATCGVYIFEANWIFMCRIATDLCSVFQSFEAMIFLMG